uniref:LAGLIDADG endonuclease n=1 Tax=Metarhizium album TaxID=92629 RepID=A0A891GX99_9HYPO|nr:LAGLIDADG endonuclease [Metarhizium album]QRK27467.1 LAGLIDADG endonuclease [Metarhizium album]
MVTSQKILEKEMGNRGSKSSKGNTLFVKEQRVDGSYIECKSTRSVLRYTLRGFERSTWAGIPSNQIINKKLYSTTKISKNILESQLYTNNDKNFILNPWFVSGFIDGDGSFSVSIAKKKSGTGWKIQPIFSIGLDTKDLDLLIQIKTYFKAGKIYTSKRGVVYYTVSSTKDIIKYILPHFDKYPLFSLKLKDYLVFKKIVLLMGEHNSLPGLFKIFSLRAILNKGLPYRVKTEFPYINPATIPEFKTEDVLNPNWLSGFITAEGSFFISLYPNKGRKAEYAVSLIFSLSQHIKDLNLLELIVKYLGCGTVRKSNSRESAEIVITKSVDIHLKLIPFLSKYPLSGVKSLDLEKFKKVSLLIENKAHLTSEGIVLIKAIKDGMYNREL